jgi:hypothetical protein
MRGTKEGQKVATVNALDKTMTDLRVFPKHSPLSLDCTNTYGLRDSYVPSGQRRCQPNAMGCGVKGGGTQAMIVSEVGGGWGKESVPNFPTLGHS